MRLFIAFPISPRVKNELECVVDELKFNKIKWVSPEQWHITVVFLGDVNTVETHCNASLRDIQNTIGENAKRISGRIKKD